MRIMHEIMKLIAQEIEENGLGALEVEGKTLRSMMFDIDTGKRLMVLNEDQLENIRHGYRFGIFCIKQFTGG